MVIGKRKLGGLVPYTTVFFSTESAFDALVAGLKPFEIARVFYTQFDREPGARIILRETSSAVSLDLCKSSESLWKGLHKKCRQHIGHAEKLSSSISIQRNGPQTERDLLEVYNSFARVKDHVSPINGKILDRYKSTTDISVIYLDGRPMCAHAALLDHASQRVRYLYLSSRRLEDRDAAYKCAALNRYLHWHEIGLYREQGFKTLDFGGIRGGPDDGIARFKLSFGGAVVSENTYLCAGSARLGQLAQMLRDRLRNRNRQPSAEVTLDGIRDEQRAAS